MATLGTDVVLLANVTVSSDARIGDHVMVLPNSVISHDDVIDEFCYLTPGVVLAGYVHLEQGAYIGAGASVRHRVTIGAGAVVGMGSVVLDDVAPGSDRRRESRPSALTAAAARWRDGRGARALLAGHAGMVRGAFAAPTAGAGRCVGRDLGGQHALVVAPTGSGKTLSAFLWSIDRLATTPRPANPRHRTASSTSRRSRRSASTSNATCARRWSASPRPRSGSGTEVPEITVGVRSGDTTSADRRCCSASRPTS